MLNVTCFMETMQIDMQDITYTENLYTWLERLKIYNHLWNF